MKPKPAKRADTKGHHRPKKKTAAKTVAKQAASKRRAAKAKVSPAISAPLTVDAYFAAVPEPARNALNQIREAVRSAVPPEATEIISYKIPAFKHRKVLVWYAAFSKHCSLFPTAAVIGELRTNWRASPHPKEPSTSL